MAPNLRFLLLLPALLASALPATIITDNDKLFPSYDFIIVGGGTSGLVVGTRLSENPKHTVLVIEAGPILDGKQEFDDVLVLPKFSDIPARGLLHQWQNHTTGPIESLNGRTLTLNMGRIVGGGSALNGKLWMRGNARDYDDWATYLQDKTWSWARLLPYFKKSETFNPPPKRLQEEAGDKMTWDLKYRGLHGPISVTPPGYYYKSLDTQIKGEIAYGVRQVKEQGSGDTLGAFWHPTALEKETYERSYTKSGYLDPLRKKGVRPNLHVLPDTTVERILFDSNGKRAIGVEHVSTPDAPKKTVLARKEVIVASGAVKSPQLLQISGIGPKKLLKSLGVPVIAELPVGENLQDHGFLTLNITLKLPNEELWRFSNETFIDAQYQQFLKNRTGMFTGTNNGRMILLPPSEFIPGYKELIKKLAAEPQDKYLPPSSSPTFKKSYKKSIALTYKSFLENKVAALELTGNFRQTLPIRPSSRGYVFAKSLSMFDAPEVNHRSLTHPLDVAIMVHSMRYVWKYMKLKEVAEWAPVVNEPVEDSTDAEIEEFVRQKMSSGTAHMCCTAPMGTVLDSKMRVRGVKDLRVVDTASWPILPGAHTTWCTAVAVGEKAADIIKEDY